MILSFTPGAKTHQTENLQRSKSSDSERHIMTASLGMFLTFISIFSNFCFSLHSFSLYVFCSFFPLSMMHYLSPLTLLGILRRAHMHRNTSPLSSRLLVFADSLWNFLSDAFLPTHCPLSFLIAVFLCTNRLFNVVADQQHLQPL